MSVALTGAVAVRDTSWATNGKVATGPTDEVVTTEGLSALYGHHVDVLHVHGRVVVVAG